MALATRCPRCDATFRVVSDQLKLRGGLVRCGSCRHVFDAIGSLSYVEEAALQPAAEPRMTAAVSPAVGPDARPAAAPGRPAAPDNASPAPAAPPAIAAGASGRDPLAVPTLVIPEAQELGRAPAARDEQAPDAVVERRSTPRGDGIKLPRSDATDSSAATATDAGTSPSAEIDLDTGAPVTGSPRATAGEAAAEPDADFLRDAKHSRGLSVVYAIGALFLALTLSAQAALSMRTEILNRWPELRPHFVEACRHYGCEVAWPARADLLAVVGTELQQLPGTDLFELSAVVRNRAQFRVALPAIEVTLTDASGRAIARKVFSAPDTLAAAGEPATRLDEGIEPGADHVVRITFEARGLRAASFVVYPFYP